MDRTIQQKALDFLEFQRLNKAENECNFILQSLAHFFMISIEEVQRRIAALAEGKEV